MAHQRVPAQAQGNADLYFGQAAVLTSRLQAAEAERESLAVALTLSMSWSNAANGITDSERELLKTVCVPHVLPSPLSQPDRFTLPRRPLPRLHQERTLVFAAQPWFKA